MKTITDHTFSCYILKYASCLKRMPKRSNMLLMEAGIEKDSFSKIALQSDA